MSDGGWEARMAARAKARGEDWARQHDAELARRWVEFERQAQWAQREMTLGQAMALLRVEPWACACVGGTNCCRFQYVQAHALQRAAHILVRQFADLAARRSRECPYCRTPAEWVESERIGPVHLTYSGSDVIEVIPERVYFSVKPCRHKVYRDESGSWVLAECFESAIGRHLWRDDNRLVVPVEEYCGACGQRRAKES